MTAEKSWHRDRCDRQVRGLYPYRPYKGILKPKNFLFNSYLQDFTFQAVQVCNLETSGSISSLEAYNRLQELWAEMEIIQTGLDLQEEEDEQ